MRTFVALVFGAWCGAVVAATPLENMLSLPSAQAGRTVSLSGRANTTDGAGGVFSVIADDGRATNNGTVFRSTMFTNLLFVRQLSGPLNVKIFGAVGDGVTDDAAAIQSAINTAAVMSGNYGGGRTVFLPKAEYLTLSSIALSNYVSLVGEGMFSTFILNAGTHDTLTGTHSYPTWPQGPSFFTISDICLYRPSAATNSPGDGIVLMGGGDGSGPGRNISLRNVWIRSHNRGLVLGSLILCDFANVRVDNAVSDGFLLGGVTSNTTLDFTSCYAAESGGHGYHITNELYVSTFDSCAADHSSGWGMYFAPPTTPNGGVDLTGVTIENNASGGIFMDGCDTYTLNASVIYHTNSFPALTTTNCSRIVVMNTKLLGGGTDWVGDGSTGLVSMNNEMNSKTVGTRLLELDSSVSIDGGYLRFADGANGYDVSLQRGGVRALLLPDAQFSVRRSNVTDNAYVSLLSGDLYNRSTISADGQIQWGIGSALRDTFLSRSGVNVMQVGGTLALRPTNSTTAITFALAGDSNNRFYLTEERLAFGPGNAAQDIIGRRNSAGLWEWDNTSVRISRSASAAEALQVLADGDAWIPWVLDSDGKITWGSGAAARDAGLYRSSAGILSISNSINVIDSITAGGSVTADNFTALGPGTSDFNSGITVVNESVDQIPLQINAIAATTNHLVDVNVDGVNKFRVAASGNTTVGGTLQSGSLTVTNATSALVTATINGPSGGTNVTFEVNQGITNRLTVASNGNVGIGTTSPSTKLSVQDASNSEIKVTRTGGAGLRLLADGVNVYVGSDTTAPLRLMVNSGTKVLINNNGNFGINTTAPNSTLHTAGSVSDSLSVGGAITLGETNMVHMVNVDASTVVIPTAVGKRGRKYEVWLISPADTMTLTNFNGAQTLNGVLSISCTGSNRMWQARSDNTSWWVTATSAP